jgi:ADP-ribose pyrophosphatase
MPGWKKTGSREIARSNFLTLSEDTVELPTGKSVQYTKFTVPNFVVVVAVTKDHKLAMILNYRYPLGRRELELPSGLMEGDELPVAAARRELEEEAGYRGGEFTEIGWYHPFSTFNDVRGYVVLARNVEPCPPKREEMEDIETVIRNVHDAYLELENGEIKHAPSIVALALARHYLHERKEDLPRWMAEKMAKKAATPPQPQKIITPAPAPQKKLPAPTTPAKKPASSR